MKTHPMRTRIGLVLHYFSVCEELVVGRLTGVQKIQDNESGFLVFAKIFSQGRAHKVLVPCRSALYLRVHGLSGQRVQAVVETITIGGIGRSRLLDIAAYSPQTLRDFHQNHQI